MMLSIGIVLIGSVVLYISFVRLHTTTVLQRQLVRLADLFFEEATEANQHKLPVTLKIHNLMIETAALAPGIAGGVVVPAPGSEISKHDLEELGDFLGRNAWVLPYLMSMSFIVSRLLFHGAPLNLRNIRGSFIANIAMALFLDREGRLTLFLDVDRTRSEVERVARLEPDIDDRLVPA